MLGDRDIGFRYSVYSDVLFDWPKELGPGELLQLNDKFDLAASGENDRFSISQISPGYYDMNTVAFYLLKGKLLYVLHGTGMLRCIFRLGARAKLGSKLTKNWLDQI